MAVGERRGVPGDECRLPLVGFVGAERHRAGLPGPLKLRLRDRAEFLKMVHDPRQLHRERVGLPVGEFESRERRNLSHQTGVDLHRDRSIAAASPSPGRLTLPAVRPILASMPTRAPEPTLPPLSTVLARLRRRRAARRVVEVARETGDVPGLVGGWVRDAFLGRPGRDLDLVLPVGRSVPFAEALARSLGSRVVAVGSPGKRILKVPSGDREVDVFAQEGTADEDLLRRDFTINALRLDLPSMRFSSPPGALDDLERHILRLPRRGVLLEDPLRVLRAARFRAELGFRMDTKALPELRSAAVLLAGIAPERKLSEMTRILATGGPAASRALVDLESWGALASLLPGTSRGARRRGVRRVGATPPGRPDLGLAALLSPFGPGDAARFLIAWKASKLNRRRIAAILSLKSVPASARKRAAIRFVRDAAPFCREAVEFLEVLGGARRMALAAACHPLLSPRRLRAVLAPRRPATPAEISSWAGTRTGPSLGRLLDDLGLALASGDLRGRRQVRAWCVARGSRPGSPSLENSSAGRTTR